MSSSPNGPEAHLYFRSMLGPSGYLTLTFFSLDLSFLICIWKMLDPMLSRAPSLLALFPLPPSSYSSPCVRTWSLRFPEATVKSFSGIGWPTVCFVPCLQAKVNSSTLPTRTSPTQSTVAPRTLSSLLTMARPTTTGLLNSQSSHGKHIQSESHSSHRSQAKQPQASTRPVSVVWWGVAKAKAIEPWVWVGLGQQSEKGRLSW